MGSWADFFTAELGAAAALTGLVIVGISINVARIIADPHLPGRAIETLVTPTGVLIASTYALVPEQPAWLFGSEIAMVGLVMLLIPDYIQWKARKILPFHIVVRRALLAQLSSLPIIACGVLIIGHVNGALYWIVPGIVVSLIATVINAWVLLVEILR
jgi:modulator of FtsH protease